MITLVLSAAVLLTCRLMVERRPRRLGGVDEKGLVVVDGNIEARGIDQTGVELIIGYTISAPELQYWPMSFFR